MTTPLISRRDLEFLLYEWLRVERLLDRPRFSDHSRAGFDAMLDVAERVASEKYLTHLKLGDANEPRLVGGKVVLIPEIGDALKAFIDTGLVGATIDVEHGGLQLPATVTRACDAYFLAANPATTTYTVLSTGVANLLLAHASKEQIDVFVPGLLDGRYFGTMCLSETGAGSALSGIKTAAYPQSDGSYRIVGDKMWIGAGDHELSENIIHMVLAKIPGSDGGVRGISLFIVPRYLVEPDGSRGERNDVNVVGLNHKMGIRSVVNAVLNFGDGTHRPGDAPGAIGFLVGQAGRGLEFMFHMMNEARIGVGTMASALGYTGYLQSVEYARDRVQGARVADRSGRQVPIIEHADVRRMLLAQKAYAEGALALSLFCADLVDEQASADEVAARQAGLLLDLLTPIAKSWPAQWCVAANDLAIQVHGGYGYTRDYNVEQLLRDNRINSIYEGTQGIQALDLLGRKVIADDGAAMAELAARIRATVAAVGATELADFADQLQRSFDHLETVTQKLWGAGDPAVTLSNATPYLQAFGHIVLAWIWLQKMSAALGKPGSFYAGKTAAGYYFYRWELPTVEPVLNQLGALDTTTLDVRPEWF